MSDADKKMAEIKRWDQVIFLAKIDQLTKDLSIMRELAQEFHSNEHCGRERVGPFYCVDREFEHRKKGGGKMEKDKSFLMWWFLFMFLWLVMFVKVAFSAEKPESALPPQPIYILPSAQEFVRTYSIKATKQMLKALATAKEAGKLRALIECPCYDISVSSTDKTIDLMVDDRKCIEEGK